MAVFMINIVVHYNKQFCCKLVPVA